MTRRLTAGLASPAVATRATKAELLWREWFLGEERFSGDPRNPGRRPSSAPRKIPGEWWQRLEAFVVRRSDYSEPGRKGSGAVGPITPALPGKLSPHFNLSEFACHNGRAVPIIAVAAVKRLAVKILEPMRAEFGPAIVMSGYRPSAYNRRIGGATYSQHIYELTPDSVAADVVFRLGTPRAWAQLADQLGAGGVGRYDGAGFVHVDNRPGEARWSG
jgi:hypothetical protein